MNQGRTLTVVGAVAMLTSALSLPAMAQEAIRDPGYCLQFYPNANCQNYRPGNPYRNSYYRHHHARYRASRAAQTPGTYFRGADGRRYLCQ